jgi:hypothetical protein
MAKFYSLALAANDWRRASKAAGRHALHVRQARPPSASAMTER